MNDLRQKQETIRDGRWINEQEPDQQPIAPRPWWVTGAVLALTLPTFAITFYFVYL